MKASASSASKFKEKGNKKQFEVNNLVLEHIETASSLLESTPSQVEKALWELIADSVENCWEMVSEYECKDVADESDDDKRSGRAEARGSQKRCRSQSQEKSQSFLRNRPTPDLILYATLFVFVLVTMALCPSFLRRSWLIG